ncbi:MAG: hypothetical protein ACREJC_20455 [Tepidisphaeraceae bacterium]
MLSRFLGWTRGWREERVLQGYSYQVSRSGKRRIVPVEGYNKRGEPDQNWLATGQWTGQDMHGRFKSYTVATSAGQRFAPAPG